MCETLIEGATGEESRFPSPQCLDCKHFLVVITDESDPSKSAPLCVNTSCELNVQNVQRGIDHPLLRCPQCGGSTTLRQGGFGVNDRWCANCGTDVKIPVLPAEYHDIVPQIKKLIDGKRA